jgi:hypothetical protein
LNLRVLPSVVFDGEVPEIPLPDPSAREVALWDLAWRTPQAHAWIDEPWRWQTVALWVRRTALAESRDANASDVNAVIRLADQIGMTPAGLKENGWSIGSSSAASPAASKSAPKRPSSKDRFKVLDGGAGAA